MTVLSMLDDDDGGAFVLRAPSSKQHVFVPYIGTPEKT